MHNGLKSQNAPNRRSTALAVLVVVSGLSACASGTGNQAELRPASQRPAVSDSYPDFSQPIDSAMEQMSDEQAARMETQLSALARQRRSGAMSQAEYLRRVRELQALSREANQQ